MTMTDLTQALETAQQAMGSLEGQLLESRHELQHKQQQAAAAASDQQGSAQRLWMRRMAATQASGQVGGAEGITSGRGVDHLFDRLGHGLIARLRFTRQAFALCLVGTHRVLQSDHRSGQLRGILRALQQHNANVAKWFALRKARGEL
mgnify:CR=1 FL=1